MAKQDRRIPEGYMPERRVTSRLTLILVILIVMLLGSVGTLIVWYATHTLTPLVPEVILQEPAPYARVWANRPNTVFAIARDQKRIAKIELWVDGQFIEGRASSVPNGTNPFPAAFDWTPEHGPHTIFLIAYTTDNRIPCKRR